MSDDSKQREPYFEQPQDTEQPHFTVGRRLREARETYDLDLREVASQLRIRPFYLEAIEETRYQDLPGATYAVGFVRAYADYLRLDSKDLVDRFKAEVEGFDTRRSLQFPVPPQEGRVPGVAILLVAILLGAAGYGVWYYLGQEGRSFTEVVDPLPQELADLAREPETVEPETVEPETVEPEAAAPAPLSGPEPSSSPPTGAAPADSQQEPAVAGSAPEPAAAPEAAQPETIDVAPAPGAVSAGEAAAEAEPAPPPEAASSGSQVLGTLPAEAELPQGPEALPSEAPELPGTEAAAPQETPLDPAAELLAQDQTSAPQPLEEEPAPQSVEEAEAQPQAEAPAAPEPVAPPPPAPSAEGAEDAADGRIYGAVNESARIVLLAEADSWVEVRDAGGRLVLSRVLREGDSFRVPDQEGLVMMTGNAGGLLITVDGRALPKMGELGQVRRDIALSPDQLLTRLPE